MQNKLKKIVMIGPVYPYKGGISHYTGMMYRELAKKYDVTMISFKMQYPKILLKREQKDYANDSFAVENTQFLINTANPFNILSVANKIKKMKPDMVIIPWWHPYFAPCFRILEFCLKRTTKILFVCHNVFPHERFPMDRQLSQMVLKHGDAFVVQSKMDESDLLAVKKNAVQEVDKLTPHPTYNAFKMQGMSKKQAREILDIKENEKVMLFFGFVREYKGLKHIINAMPAIISGIGTVKLLIVGDFDAEREQYINLIKENGVNDYIEIVEGYIPDREVEKYFAACDLVTLPYESATQSGIVQIAYGFDKPVIVTNVGGLPDVVSDGKTGYVVESKNPKKLAEAVVRYYSESKEEEFSKNVQAEAYKYSWDRMLEVIEELWDRMEKK